MRGTALQGTRALPNPNPDPDPTQTHPRLTSPTPAPLPALQKYLQHVVTMLQSAMQLSVQQQQAGDEDLAEYNNLLRHGGWGGRVGWVGLFTWRGPPGAGRARRLQHGGSSGGDASNSRVAALRR